MKRIAYHPRRRDRRERALRIVRRRIGTWQDQVDQHGRMISYKGEAVDGQAKIDQAILEERILMRKLLLT